jgi:hypothetical protein
VINVERNFHYYLFKIMVPLFLIFILNFAGLTLPVTALNDRLQHSVTLFLSSFALMYVIAPDVPKTTYQTPIDKFILVTISLLAATAIHAVLLAELVPQHEGAGPCSDVEHSSIKPVGILANYWADVLALLANVVSTAWSFTMTLLTKGVSPALGLVWKWYQALRLEAPEGIFDLRTKHKDSCRRAENLDRTVEALMATFYVFYLVWVFWTPWFQKKVWREQQKSTTDKDTDVSEIQKEDNKPLHPPAHLRLQGVEHIVDQILENPFAGCPPWLAKKNGISAEVGLEVIPLQTDLSLIRTNRSWK